MSPAPPRRLGEVEFTALLAGAMALAALGIDLLLPAFGDVRADLGLPADSTAVAGLVTAYFLGLALGQPLYGPASDAFGRRPLLQVSFVVYGVGALATALSPTLPLLLASRLLWGLGAAGPRVLVIAIIRDRFEGERMSRAMSMTMSVFMVVPVLAPSVGAAAITVGSWRWLFVACAVAVAALAVWALRLQESLAPEDRHPLRLSRLVAAGRTVVSDRQTVGYTLAMTAMYAGFTSYLASSELIYDEVFGVTALFPVLFGGLAVVMAAAMAVNARVVERIGSRRLSHGTLVGYVAASAALLAGSLLTGGRPPLWLFLVTMAAILAGHAVIVPNFNTLAMAPMGQVAGMASSLTGAVQVAVGALLGAVIDRLFDGTIGPLSAAMLGSAVVVVGLVRWAEGGPLTLRRADADGDPGAVDAAGAAGDRGPEPPTGAEVPAAL